MDFLNQNRKIVMQFFMADLTNIILSYSGPIINIKNNETKICSINDFIFYIRNFVHMPIKNRIIIKKIKLENEEIVLVDLKGESYFYVNDVFLNCFLKIYDDPYKFEKSNYYYNECLYLDCNNTKNKDIFFFVDANCLYTKSIYYQNPSQNPSQKIELEKILPLINNHLLNGPIFLIYSSFHTFCPVYIINVPEPDELLYAINILKTIKQENDIQIQTK